MFAIKEGERKINGKIIDTFSRDITEPLTGMTVEAGTTGFMGSPHRGAGGRTYVSFVVNHGDFHFEPVRNDNGQMAGFEIACCGDGGLNAILRALAFAYEATNDQANDVED